MRLGQLLVLVDGVEEGISLCSHFLVFNGYHLIEIYGLSLILYLWLLVTEPNGSRAERLQVVSGAQLIVEDFQLVLDLGVVAPWPGVYL